MVEKWESWVLNFNLVYGVVMFVFEFFFVLFLCFCGEISKFLEVVVGERVKRIGEESECLGSNFDFRVL